MEPVYTEIEFEEFDQTPGPLYQALKGVPTSILYRELHDKKERLAVILLNDRNLPDVEKIAAAFKTKIAKRLDIAHSAMMAVVRGDNDAFFDGYDTRDQRFWLGPWAARRPKAE